jgi:hypothetical protein
MKTCHLSQPQIVWDKCFKENANAYFMVSTHFHDLTVFEMTEVTPSVRFRDCNIQQSTTVTPSLR